MSSEKINLSISLRPQRARRDRVSDAIAENQIVSVLLHRVDEELLHGNLIHGNTSLEMWCGGNRKMNV